jgi:hypothetical protein
MLAFMTASTVWANRCSTHLRNALALLFGGRRTVRPRARSKQSGYGDTFQRFIAQSIMIAANYARVLPGSAI